MHYYDLLETPVGELLLVSNEDGALTHLYTRGAQTWVDQNPAAKRDPARLVPVRRQIEEYFAGKRTSFEVDLAPKGSEFQHRVWAALRRIPFGETRTYGQLAAELGVPNASRAVGRANATNPISVIVPCHRVIGANGTLTGYAGGLPTKQWLLAHEGVKVKGEQATLEL